MSKITTRFALSLVFAWALGSPAIIAGNTDIKPEQVAPGVWRIHLGDPEKLTPLSFRTAPPRLDGFGDLPNVPMPLDIGAISFSVTGRGCSVQLPMTKDERIYGLGMNTNLFEMTTDADAFKDPSSSHAHPGRHAFLRPTDHPENDLNESHAPVPFYLSNLGYGVYVDTARYTSFYTGNVAPQTSGTSGNSNASGGLSTAELYKARELNKKTMLVDIPSALFISSAARSWEMQSGVIICFPVGGQFLRSGAWEWPTGDVPITRQVTL